MASNREYLVDLLREDMGFEGMLVTDYNEVRLVCGWVGGYVCLCVCV